MAVAIGTILGHAYFLVATDAVLTALVVVLGAEVLGDGVSVVP